MLMRDLYSFGTIMDCTADLNIYGGPNTKIRPKRWTQIEGSPLISQQYLGSSLTRSKVRCESPVDSFKTSAN